MPKLALQATTTVKVTPQVKRKLLKELQAYQVLAEEIAPLKLALKKRLAAIGKLREEAGADKLELEGFKVAKVGGSYLWWDVDKLLTFIDVDQLDQVRIKKDKRPYERVTLPGEKDDSDE